MAAIAFNPSKAVVFDLARGGVHLGRRSSGEAGPAHVLLPTELFATLVDHYAGARALGHTVGTDVVKRALARGGQDTGSMRSLTLAEVVDLVGGELALLGLGSLRVERWGDAMLFVLDPCALDARADAFVEGLVEGIVEVGGARDAHAVVIDRADGTVRVLIGGPEAAERAKEMAAVGAPFTEIVTELQEGGNR